MCQDALGIIYLRVNDTTCVVDAINICLGHSCWWVTCIITTIVAWPVRHTNTRECKVVNDRKSCVPSSASMNQLLLYIEFPIDFKGQQLCSDYVNKLLIVSTVLSVAIGFATQKIEHVVYTFGASLVIILAASLPNWSIYNQNPVQWLRLSYLDNKDDFVEVSN